MSFDLPPEKIDAAVKKIQRRNDKKDILWGIAAYGMMAVFALVAIFSAVACFIEGVRELRTLLDALTSAAFLIIIVYVIMFLRDVVKRVFQKVPIKWGEYHPRTWFETKTGVVLVLVVIGGIANLTAGSIFRSTEIGAFYEKTSYDETYEAILVIEENPIFCLAEMSRSDGDYTIWEVHLPYGKSCYTDCEYDPGEPTEQIDINDYYCSIELVRPATDQSYTMLENTFISNYGEFCASKSSDVFHFLDCPAAKRINPSNLVYFRDEREARVLGFEVCGVCGLWF